MTYLLILFVIALALAPLTHFLPSRKQRKIARMREYAALHGMFVEFREPPGGGRIEVHPGSVIYYGKRIPATVGDAVKSTSWVCRDGEWLPLEGRSPVPSQLAGINVDLLAAGVDGSSCGVYWIESEDENSVQEICQALEAWATDLAG